MRQLEIPSPFDVRVLCDRVAERSGRPIHLAPVSLPTQGPCGLWVSTDEVDFIFYEEQTSRFHQEHIIAHELGHLLCDHHAAEIMSEESSRLILPNLDPGMVERVLQRTHYSAVEEQEAELIASLILQEANRRRPEPTWSVPSEAADIVERLDRSLRHAPRGRE
ncbi:ImmA/IrrE family metallo-endopeptidase [Streptomyces sp. URMC 123]|uniref:ImmA/IrrE family metallo-endopeptidase n=1 Tax=Streptomyces sp. URMC 123 TaxID=3423403 RepID=UPI003F1BD634